MRCAKHVLPWRRMATIRPATATGPKPFNSSSPADPRRAASWPAQCVTGYRVPKGSTPRARSDAIISCRRRISSLPGFGSLIHLRRGAPPPFRPSPHRMAPAKPALEAPCA